MYLRAVHSTFHLPTLYDFIRRNALGLLTTTIASEEHPLIQASHIPWILDEPDYSEDGDEDASAREAKGLPLGVLRGHLSRANPQAEAIIEAAQKLAGSKTDANGRMQYPDGPVTLPEEVLVMFTGIEHYVTPKFYTATKPATGKVVPTWNYEAVQAYGRITVYPSTTSDQADRFLSQAIHDLSHQQEFAMGYDGLDGRRKEWQVADAPEKFIGLLKKSIVGVSIEITRLGGKFKMSQEVKKEDREGVIEGFGAIGEVEMKDSVQKWREKS